MQAATRAASVEEAGISDRVTAASAATQAGMYAQPSVLGAVLAAGTGTRYGLPKISAHEGEWLRIAVAALVAGGCDEVAVAMGARVVDVPSGTAPLVVADWSAGLSATVREVLEWATDHASTADVAGVVLHVVDTPDVDDRVICRIVEAAGRRRDRLVRATFHGRPGHPVYIGADHFERVAAHLHGDAGAGTYLRTRSDVVTIDCEDLATGVDHDTR